MKKQCKSLVKQYLLLLFLFLGLWGYSQTVNYQPFYTNTTFDNKSINVNLAVGATSGSANVVNGAATYSIPIASAPRPKGISHYKPSISLVYNSMSGDGILGRGWNISAGNSVISRRQQTIAQNITTEPICTSVDEFMLDGNRLIHDASFSAKGSSTEKWYTEQENFSEIYSYRNSSGIIDRWNVTSKDGILYTYGYYDENRTFTSNSSGNNTSCNLVDGAYLNFYVHSITNLQPFANNVSIGFEYENANDNIVTLKSVIDNLNSKSSQVLFNYKLRNDVTNHFSNGKLLKNEQLLDNIIVKDYDGNIIRKYTMKYNFDGINSFLSELQEETNTGEKLNPTIFKYGDRNYGSSIWAQNDLLNISSGGDMVWTGVNNNVIKKYFPGDFNGDGYTDMAEYRECTNCLTPGYSAIHISFNDKNNYYNSGATINLNSGANLFTGISNNQERKFKTGYSADYDGNGVDDILVYQISSNYELISTELYLFNESGGYTTVSKPFPTISQAGNMVDYRNVIKVENFIQTGDFDGDGNMDYILFLADAANNYNYQSFISYPSRNMYNRKLFELNPFNGGNVISNSTNTADKVIVLDFDGDGKSDIMSINDDNTLIYSFDYLPQYRGDIHYLILSIIYSGTFPNKTDNIYPGDFNGDKKTDLLVVNNPQRIAYSNGLIFTEDNLSNNFFTPNENNTSNCYSYLAVSDFNGDGKSDILQILNGGSSAQSCIQLDATINYSGQNSNKANYTFDASLLNKIRIGENYILNSDYCFNQTLVGDFNGDGKSDLNIEVKYPNCISANSNEYRRKHIYFNENGNELVLEKVKSGLGNVTEFKYETLPRISDYVKKYNGQSTYLGNNYINAPMRVVTSIITEDNIGSHELMYKYKGALFNKNGYGLLGFREVITIDDVFHRENIAYTNGINSNATYPHILIPDKNEIYRTTDNMLLETQQQYYTYVKRNDGMWLRKDRDESSSYLSGTHNTYYTYDASGFGNIVEINSVDNANNSVKTTYNFGSKLSERPALPELKTVEYIRSGLPTISYTTKFEYYPSSNGLLWKKIDYHGLPNPITTTFEYNSNNGQVKKETVSSTGVSPIVNQFIYDADDMALLKTINPLNQEVNFTYNNLFQITSQTGIDGLTTIFEYDAWGRKNKEILPSGKVINDYIVWDLSKSNSFGFPSVYKSFSTSSNAPTNYTIFNKQGKIYISQTQAANGNYLSTYHYYDRKGSLTITEVKDQTGLLFGKSEVLYDEFDRPYETRKFNKNNSYVVTQTNSYTKSGNFWQVTTSVPSSASNSTGSSYFKKTTLDGELVESNENGTNILTYQYDAEGKNIKILSSGAVLTETVYDAYSRKQSLKDMSAGMTTYQYTALGQLYQQTTASNGFERYTYDILGRKTKVVLNEGTLEYFYYPNGAGVKTGKIQKVTGYQMNAKEEFDYDALGRLNKVTNTVSNTSSVSPYVTEISYNADNRITTKTTPTGNVYNFSYNSLGALTDISRGGNSIYSVNNYYTNGLIKEYYLGSTLVTKNYDDYYQINNIQSAYINDDYDWDPVNLNLKSKKENLQGFEYVYTYDNFERLTDENLTTRSITNHIDYFDNGNIDWKHSAGVYEYHSGKRIFAVKAMLPAQTNTPDHFPSYQQSISYASFNRPTNISLNGRSVGIQYNPSFERSCATFNLGGVNPVKINRYYIGNTEIDYFYSNYTNTFKHSIDYIYAGDELVAMDVKDGTNAMKTWWVQTDYQGNIRSVFDNRGAAYYQNFDAWGTPRNTITGDRMNNGKPSGLPDWLYRGYTGHEHYYDFGLINMGARLYDPHNSRVLSPDNFVQSSTLQGFNRYSYANNNPLKYSDPDGNIVVPALIGLGIALASKGVGNLANGQNFFAGEFGGWVQAGIIGFASGAMTASVGNIFGEIGTFGHEMLRGVAHGMSSGYFSAASGGNFMTGFASGSLSSIAGSGFYGLTQFPTSHIASYIFSGVAGGIGSYAVGGSIWEGAITGLLVQGLNHATHSNSIEEYSEPVREEIALNAESKLNSNSYGYDVRIDNFDEGTWKCNKFVYDVTTESGASPGTPNGRFKTSPPSAGQWANPKYSIKNWKVVSSPKRGDVVAYSNPTYREATGHTGIMVSKTHSISAGNILVKYSDFGSNIKLIQGGSPYIYRRYYVPSYFILYEPTWYRQKK